MCGDGNTNPPSLCLSWGRVTSTADACRVCAGPPPPDCFSRWQKTSKPPLRGCPRTAIAPRALNLVCFRQRALACALPSISCAGFGPPKKKKQIGNSPAASGGTEPGPADPARSRPCVPYAHLVAASSARHGPFRRAQPRLEKPVSWFCFLFCFCFFPLGTPFDFVCVYI